MGLQAGDTFQGVQRGLAAGIEARNRNLEREQQNQQFGQQLQLRKQGLGLQMREADAAEDFRNRQLDFQENALGADERRRAEDLEREDARFASDDAYRNARFASDDAYRNARFASDDAYRKAAAERDKTNMILSAKDSLAKTAASLRESKAKRVYETEEAKRRDERAAENAKRQATHTTDLTAKLRSDEAARGEKRQNYAISLEQAQSEIEAVQKNIESLQTDDASKREYLAMEQMKLALRTAEGRQGLREALAGMELQGVPVVGNPDKVIEDMDEYAETLSEAISAAFRQNDVDLAQDLIAGLRGVRETMVAGMKAQDRTLLDKAWQDAGALRDKALERKGKESALILALKEYSAKKGEAGKDDGGPKSLSLAEMAPPAGVATPDLRKSVDNGVEEKAIKMAVGAGKTSPEDIAQYINKSDRIKGYVAVDPRTNSLFPMPPKNTRGEGKVGLTLSGKRGIDYEHRFRMELGDPETFSEVMREGADAGEVDTSLPSGPEFGLQVLDFYKKKIGYGGRQ